MTTTHTPTLRELAEAAIDIAVEMRRANARIAMVLRGEADPETITGDEAWFEIDATKGNT